MRQIKKSVHSGYAVAKQVAQRYAEISFCDRLQASSSTYSAQITDRVDSRKQVIMLKNTKITLFKPYNVVLVHGKPGLVTDEGENGLMKIRSFADLRNYFEEPFHYSDRNIYVLDS